MADNVVKANRVIHYYEILIDPRNEYRLEVKYESFVNALLSKIVALVAKKSPDRYLKVGEKNLFINEIKFDITPEKRVLKGKLLSIRTDNFPSIHNMNTDQGRDIEAEVEEGVYETTHFVIQEKRHSSAKKVNLCIEYNQFGARVNDLQFYMQTLGQRLGIVNSVSIVGLTRDPLKGFKRRMGQVATIFMKIHKENIPALESVDGQLFQSMDLVADQFAQDYITVELKYSIRANREFPGSNSAIASKTFVEKFVDLFTKDQKAADLFDQFLVKAEDSDKLDKLNSFDLLINKIKDQVSVEKRANYRAILSNDMYEKMVDSWERNKIKI